MDVRYEIRPTRRGLLSLPAPRANQRSRLGLFWSAVQGTQDQDVRIYPNFMAVARYALLAASARTAELGIRKTRRRGEGTEFHQLREYRAGDPLRQIDWQATSRVLRPISRDYREEQDQQVLLMLDCGRAMHAPGPQPEPPGSRTERSAVARHVALSQGDAVGLIAYGGPKRSVAPRKGRAHLARLLNATFDLGTSTEASDVVAAVESALQHLRRRTLIVLVTNIREEPE